jgi:uncharacterized protein YndB with AHSA1/START domain
MKQLDTAAAAPALEIVRIFDAPRERVFRAWTDPEVGRLWYAPKGHTATHIHGEVREGSSWRVCMRNDETGGEMWQGRFYREVTPPEYLAFTLWWEGDDGLPEHEMLVTVRFEDLGGKTKMTFRQANFASQDSRDRHEGGWNSVFDNLAAALGNVA